LFAALALFAFAFGNLGGLIHQATTRHVQCPEHGDLMHSDEPDGTGAAVAVHDLDACRAGVKAPSSAPRHRHDHCYIGSLARERMAASSLKVACDHAPPVPVMPALAGDPGAVARSLYRTAPKTSPPV
jgi:hypothetical protein